MSDRPKRAKTSETGLIIGPKRQVPTQVHHIRQQLCTTRAEYRRGKKKTAVKVFSVADESTYLLVHNVPTLSGVNMGQELESLCCHYGSLLNVESVQCDTVEPFTQVFLVKFGFLVDAIRAKKALDDYVLLGSPLHVCYAPEFETVQETRAKINARQRYVNIKLAQFSNLTAK